MTLNQYKEKILEIVNEYVPENTYNNLFFNVCNSPSGFFYSVKLWVYGKYIESGMCNSPEEALEIFRVRLSAEHKMTLIKEELKDKPQEDMEITNG
jgi:hypothetical protein